MPDNEIDPPVAVQLRDIHKSYGDVRANNGVDLTVYDGEIHAVVGENGAGKSTLMKILYGVVQPDEGSIALWGKRIRIASSLDAIRHGVGMVFQHFTLAPSLTVAENVVLGNEPHRQGWLKQREIDALVRKLGQSFGLNVPPGTPVSALSVSEQQRVEILKALYRRARLLILDEPTAVLTPQETESLFEMLRALKAEGHTLVFISHKLLEVKAIADRISVMRQGEMVDTVDADDVTPADIATLMVGRPVLANVAKPVRTPGERVLAVDSLTVQNDVGVDAVRSLTLTVRAGEILGLAGVEGNGQGELLECLSGLRAAKAGRIELSGDGITGASVRARRERGLAFIPPDRRSRGVAEQARIDETLLADRLYKPPLMSRLGLRPHRIRQRAEALIDEYHIKAAGPRASVSSLSGGNMQKVVVARELSSEPKVLIAAEPTRGIDVAATEYVHQRLVAARNEGVGVLLLTSDLDELLDLADRIAVIYKGEIVAVEDNREKVDPKTLGKYMMGIEKQDAGALQARL